MFGRRTPKSILKETAKYGLCFFLRCGYHYQHFSFGTVSWRSWESLILVCLKLFVRQCQENPSDDPGKHSHEPALHIGDSVIGINGFLNILGVHIDDKLSFNDHPLKFLKKVYAKVGALRRLRKLVPADIALMLYKAYILPHLEYCRPLPLGINKTLNKKLESANYQYEIKTHENPVKFFMVNSHVFHRFFGRFWWRIFMGFSRKNTMNMA